MQDKSAHYRTFGEAIQIFSCFVYERYMLFFIISWRKRFQLISSRGLAHTFKQVLQLDTTHLSYSMLLAKNPNWNLNGWTDKRKLFCINLRNWACQFGQIEKKTNRSCLHHFRNAFAVIYVTQFPRNKISMRIDNVQTKRIQCVGFQMYIFNLWQTHDWYFWIETIKINLI